MKRTCLAFVVVGLLAFLTGGCVLDAHHPACDGPQCPRCQQGSQGSQGAVVGAPGAGPAAGAVTYPYYTTRGPRDYFDKNPESVGP